MPSFIRTTTLPQLEYNGKTGRYHDSRTHRFVKKEAVVRALDRQLDQTKSSIAENNKQLRAGAVNLETWRSRMVADIKQAHTVQYVVGKGGWASMSQSDYGRLGNVLKREYRRINQFVRDVQATYPTRKDLDGRFDTRAEMYANTARTTYQAARRVERQETGLRFEKRVLNPAEHCQGCIDAAEQGWQPIHTLPAIGSLECNAGCKCEMIYK